MHRAAYHHFFSRTGTANREQNLLVSLSKHYYLQKYERIAYRKKPIDPRVPGERTPLRRIAVLDVDTGVFYGEFHHTEESIDLIGFLARAWHTKVHNPMRGFPRQLNIPRAMFVDAELHSQLRWLQPRAESFSLSTLPSGFQAGAHVAKGLESELQSSISMTDDKLNLFYAQMMADIMSAQASNTGIAYTKAEWLAIPPPPSSFFAEIDSQYPDCPGFWRQDQFAIVLGLKSLGELNGERIGAE